MDVMLIILLLPLFFLFASPLLGLILLMIHVARNLPRRRETQGDF